MKLPKIVIPLIVVVFAAGGYLSRPLFILPTTTNTFAAEANATAEFIVDGLKCRGTGGFFMSLYEETPGIASLVTYAEEHRAVFTYDTTVISSDGIQSIFEADVLLADSSRQRVFTMQSAIVED